MDSLLVAAALLSAALHASWNAAVKAHPQPTQAMTGQMLLSALLALPVLAFTGLPAAAAVPWMLVSTTMNMGAVSSLLRAYEHAGFGVAYPMARASSVLLVLPLAVAVAGEWPHAAALLGVALVATAVLLLARGPKRALSRPALLWTAAGAAFTACYVVFDAQGVRRSGSPLAYGCVLAFCNGLLWTAMQRQRALQLRSLLSGWPRTLAMSLAATLSYWLILWVWTRAPTAPAAALRDTSAIFAALIAATVLKERIDGRVIAAVLLATAGTVAIRLG